MMDTPEIIIREKIDVQKRFFASQKTKNVNFRIDQLKKLKLAIVNYQAKITDALWKDLHKSGEESYLTELSIVKLEIDYHIKHLRSWSKVRRMKTPIHLFPSASYLMNEPLGVVLIVAPWNYPVQLLLNPLIGAISAGCCAVLKPSPDAPHVAKIIEQLVAEYFAPSYISIVQGGKKSNIILFQQFFDLIFYTGSSKLGKIVMKAAAENLTPVILELGGKSPCIVDKEANLDVAAKRIMWGKLVNAGQTCVAPDYLFVHKEVKEALLEKMKLSIKELYPGRMLCNANYPRIVTHHALQRLLLFLQHGNIVVGADYNIEDRYLAPTIIDEVKSNYPIMQEEIFGPILPVMSFEELDEVVAYLNEKDKPLALYYFGKKKKAKRILSQTSSGGVCVNDVVVHVANHFLPFGGVGNSGFGSYHGKSSFFAFSKQKSIIKTPVWIDLPLRYPPFKYFKFIKKFI